MNKDKCDILIPVFFFYGRDIEALILVKYFLEETFNLKVAFCSVFDPYTVDIYNPKVVLMENTAGSTFHVEYAEYVQKKGTPLISLVSEGAVQEKHLEDLIWGYNYKHKILFDKVFVWTPALRDAVKKRIPQLANRVDFSGGLGFDRYKIYKFNKQKAILKKYKKSSYTRVVGYAGFVFSPFLNEAMKIELIKRLSIEQYNLIRKEKDLVSGILFETIKACKDTLFILKQHPGESSSDMEIKERWNKEFPNVLYFREEEPLTDLINLCDIWINYISTTCLEAWLLGKVTINIIPSKNYKFQNLFYKGGICVETAEQLSLHIREYYRDGKIIDFDKKIGVRKKLINSFIYRADGLNAWRTAKKIHQFYSNPPRHSSQCNFLIKLRFLVQHLFLKVASSVYNLPIINKSVIIKWYSEYPKVFELEDKYRPFLKNMLHPRN